MTARKQPKSNPTNAEIMLKLDQLDRKGDKQASDILQLQQWKRDTEIAKTAVTEYLKDNPLPKSTQGSDQWLNRELVKTLGIALAVILALVELLVQLKGLGK